MTSLFADEAETVQMLLEAVKPLDALHQGVKSQAETWVKAVRSAKSAGGIEAFLQEYGLNSGEGIAIMCLAEALLRIPDSTTADLLIEHTFQHKDWEKHLGHSDSWFVNASSWGLLLTGKIVEFTKQKPESLLRHLTQKYSPSVIRESLRKAMTFIGTQFVMGETIEKAAKNAEIWQKKGYRLSFDMLGEGARSQTQANAYFHAYLHAIETIGKQAAPSNDMPSISVKLSGLHPRYELTQEKRLFGELLPRLKLLALKAKDHGIALSIDAEEANRFDIGLSLFSALFSDPELKNYDGLGYVLQAYQKRAYATLDLLVAMAAKEGKQIPLRLVKGAYWDAEIKHAQVNGLAGYPVFTRKEHTDLSYLACAVRIFEHGRHFAPQFATHNALTAASIVQLAAGRPFEFQRLHGMGEKLHDHLLKKAPCRIYAPVGKQENLLAYLIRRLLENGANSSFVHVLADKNIPIKALLEDPIAKSRADKGLPNPHIPLPKDMYGNARWNSTGFDLGYRQVKEQIETALSKQTMPENTPAETSETEAAQIMEQAQAAFDDWNKLTVNKRAAMLENAADMLEKQCDEFLVLLVEEAGKTIPDAIAEIREATDFCRYYAAQARNIMSLTILPGPTGEHNSLQLSGRGVFVCISPWNFPLAIFLGQIAAALVTGNMVVAKPAGQTPKIAIRAIRLLYEAGFPEHAVQLAIGSGSFLGNNLVNHPFTAGVAFTGSTGTARHINRALAAKDGPIVPLIAETGGQNAMIIDSSALLEQTVDDVIVSAFGSAGQRCSALRVLYIQEDIAESFTTLLAGAMQTRTVGDPRNTATDIGPVIDAVALGRLQEHVAYLSRIGKKLGEIPLQKNIIGNYFAPVAYEIASIRQLKDEVFGPVLHIIRFASSDIDNVIEEINGTGYGLTFGLHSRIGSRIAEICGRIRAGNLYVNRSMTGAVVGVQPFGGEGLSGTGPKAGGPHYLLRFVTERTLSINSTAIGGNVELLA